MITPEKYRNLQDRIHSLEFFLDELKEIYYGEKVIYNDFSEEEIAADQSELIGSTRMNIDNLNTAINEIEDAVFRLNSIS